MSRRLFLLQKGILQRNGSNVERRRHRGGGSGGSSYEHGVSWVLIPPVQGGLPVWVNDDFLTRSVTVPTHCSRDLFGRRMHRLRKCRPETVLVGGRIVGGPIEHKCLPSRRTKREFRPPSYNPEFLIGCLFTQRYPQSDPTHPRFVPRWWHLPFAASTIPQRRHRLAVR